MSSGREIFHRYSRKTPPQLILGKSHHTKVAMNETIGKRPTQEDTMIAFIAEGFSQLNPDHKFHALNAICELMQKHYGQYPVGSTLNGTIAYLHKNIAHTWNVNVGDSMSFIIILTADNKVKKIKRLNTHLHNVGEATADELQRIQNEGGEIFNKRVSGHLSLTRAIGNIDVKGVSSIPEIKSYDFELKSKERIFLLTTCDGLMERDALTKEEIAAFIAQYSDKLPVAAHKLIKAALQISCDNISLCLAEITHNEEIAFFVFDGHRGNEVSNNLAEFFYPNFIHIINQCLQFQKKLENFKESDVYQQLKKLSKNMYRLTQFPTTTSSSFVLLQLLSEVNKVTTFAKYKTMHDQLTNQLTHITSNEFILNDFMRDFYEKFSAISRDATMKKNKIRKI